MEPARSLPWAMAPIPVATAAAAPPLEPPAVRSGAQGFSVRPCRSFSVNQRNENAGAFVRPMIIAPARRKLTTTGLSSAGDQLSVCNDTIVGWMSPLIGIDLDRDRHTMQRAEGHAAPTRHIGRIGLSIGLLAERSHNCIDARVHRLQSLDDGRDHLATRHNAKAGQLNEFDCIKTPQLARRDGPAQTRWHPS